MNLFGNKKIRNAKKEFNLLVAEMEIANEQQVEDIMIKQPHDLGDHYHGIHHFDKYGNHDDVSEAEFSLRSHLRVTKKSLTFKISMAALVLALSVAVSAIDMLLERFTINIGGVSIDMRILDLLVIIIGIPIVGLVGSMLIGVVEPWFHLLIDGDHSPIQIGLDSVGYALVVLLFFFIFYIVFRNSPIHKEPSKTKRIFKDVVPFFIIVPIAAFLFAAIFALSLFLTFQSGRSDYDWPDMAKDFAPIFFAAVGLQAARFAIMYVIFVIFENKMKPINHRYQ